MKRKKLLVLLLVSVVALMLVTGCRNVAERMVHTKPLVSPESGTATVLALDGKVVGINVEFDTGYMTHIAPLVSR